MRRIGVILGIAVGFAIGYSASFLIFAGGPKAWGFWGLYLPIVIVATVLTGRNTRSRLAVVISSCVTLLCLVVAGVGEHDLGTYIWICFAIPFATLGATNGYFMGQARLTIRQQEINRLEKEKAEIIEMIDEVLEEEKRR
ncbi:MAG: hypothetical protein WBH01_05805 [Dehalococcoidia bacterium]